MKMIQQGLVHIYNNNSNTDDDNNNNNKSKQFQYSNPTKKFIL